MFNTALKTLHLARENSKYMTSIEVGAVIATPRFDGVVSIVISRCHTVLTAINLTPT